jgi:hypothetical protein
MAVDEGDKGEADANSPVDQGPGVVSVWGEVSGFGGVRRGVLT